MNKLLLGLLIISTIFLYGCSSKVSNNVENNIRSSINSNQKPIPKLSIQQKNQIKSKITPALNDIDDALKSLQDPSDINVDSIN